MLDYMWKIGRIIEQMNNLSRGLIGEREELSNCRRSFYFSLVTFSCSIDGMHA